MESLVRDVRHAFRTLARTPGFTTAAAATLALGIGANAAIFSLVNAVFLRPLPVADPDSIVGVFTSDSGGPLYGGSSFPDYRDLRDRNDVFLGLVAYAPQPLALAWREGTELVVGETVTGDYFSLLGVPAALGRPLRPADDAADAPPVVVLSHLLWSRRFGADESVVGRAVTLNGHAFVVVGVAPASFTGMVRGLSVDAWIPMHTRPLVRPGESLENRGARGLLLAGRLEPGVSVDTAQAQLAVLAAQLEQAHPEEWTDVRGEGRRISVLPEARIRVFPELQGAVLGFLGLLTAVAGLVLLIACANVANLFLARVSAQRREIAIRLSLGAARGRVVRQFVTESGVLALVGGGLGLLVAVWAVDVLSAVPLPLPVPVRLAVGLDARVLGFTCAVSVLTGLAAGLLPALQASGSDPAPVLRDESLSGGPRRSRLRSAFVVSQVAVSLILLVGAGLLLRSLGRAASIDPGFSVRRGLLLSVDLSLSGYSDARGRAYFEEAHERVASLPGVESATWATSVPLGLDWMRRRVWVEGRADRAGEDMEFGFSVVAPQFFETLGLPLVRGRAFDQRDREGTAGVAMVNEAFALRFWPGENPIGKRLSVSGDDGAMLEVVGVARDGKYFTLGEAPRPFFYLPLFQAHEPSATLVVRTGGDPAAAAPAVRAALEDLDRSVPLLGVKTLAEHLGLSLLPTRVAGAALGLFGLLGLVLASLGVYAVVAHSVGQRTHEIGVRMALGAARGDVVRLVVIEGMTLVAVGLCLGLAGSLALSRLLSGFLYELSPTDPVTFGGVALVLIGAALIAAYVPARRAAQVEPLVALRYE